MSALVPPADRGQEPFPEGPPGSVSEPDPCALEQPPCALVQDGGRAMSDDGDITSHADPLHRYPVARSASRRGGRDHRHLRALRLLHRDLSDLCAVPRRERIPRAAASISSAPCWRRAARRTPKTVHHLDRCLSCLSCMTTCAVKVDYTHLIDIARAFISSSIIAGRSAIARCAVLIADAAAVSAPFRGWRMRLATAGAKPLRPMIAGAAAPAARCGVAARRASRIFVAPAGVSRARRQRRCASRCSPDARSKRWTRKINAATIRLLQSRMAATS